MPDDVRWIRSYVLEEGGGSVGTVCIYEATSPEAIRKHASLADLPVDEIIAVADTVDRAARSAAGERERLTLTPGAATTRSRPGGTGCNDRPLGRSVGACPSSPPSRSACARSPAGTSPT